MKGKISLWIQAGFYTLGGINHFVNPDFYLELIPKYFIYINELNIIAGIVEVVLGLSLLSNQLRKYAAYGIILMLIAFIPSHIYFIQIGGCVEGGLCAPVWIGWVRLILVHPLLMLWAWSVKRSE
jgi:uncharacterized membrane protein